MRSVGHDALFFWTKTTTFPCSGKAAACWKRSMDEICKAPSLALRWSYSLKMFKTVLHKVAKRLQQLPEGRCHSPLSWASSGTGAAAHGADKFLSQPKINMATASGRGFRLVQEAERVLVWHGCEISRKAFVSIKPEMVCVELTISPPTVDAPLCPWPWGQEIAYFMAWSKATETSL